MYLRLISHWINSHSSHSSCSFWCRKRSQSNHWLFYWLSLVQTNSTTLFFWSIGNKSCAHSWLRSISISLSTKPFKMVQTFTLYDFRTAKSLNSAMLWTELLDPGRFWLPLASKESFVLYVFSRVNIFLLSAVLISNPTKTLRFSLI